MMLVVQGVSLMVRKRRKHDFLDEKLGFGCHQNKRWRDVPDSYLVWVLSNIDDWLINKLARMERKRREKKQRVGNLPRVSGHPRTGKSRNRPTPLDVEWTAQPNVSTKHPRGVGCGSRL